MSSIKPIAYLFPQTSRAQTPNAPPYDPTRKVKTWVDPNPGAEPTVTYQVLDLNGKVGDLTLSVTEASSLNLPGHPDYPHYVQSPTKSAFAVSGVPPPFGVSNLSDTQRLATAFGLTDTAIFDEMGAFPGETIAWDPNDPRRCYGIKFSNGNYGDVATLVAQQNSAGIGAPGEWKQDTAGNWLWRSELAPDPVNPAIMPMPLAPLPPGATLIPGSITTGGVPAMVLPEPPASSVVNFDPAADPTLQKILEGVTSIRGLFHV